MFKHKSIEHRKVEVVSDTQTAEEQELHDKMKGMLLWQAGLIVFAIGLLYVTEEKSAVAALMLFSLYLIYRHYKELIL